MSSIEQLNLQILELKATLFKEVYDLKQELYATKQELNQTKELLSQALKEREVSYKWTTVDHHLISFVFQSTEVTKVIIPFEVVPVRSREVKIFYYLRTGHEGPSRVVDIDLWTIVGGVQYHEKKKGWRYPQDAISWESNNIWFPISAEDRNLYFRVNDVQLQNCHGMELRISGFR